MKTSCAIECGGRYAAKGRSGATRQGGAAGEQATTAFIAAILYRGCGGHAVRSAGAREGPRQAGRTAAALEADLAALVLQDLAAGALEPRTRRRVARHDDRAPRRDRQDVGAHGVELLVRDLDEGDAA